MSEDTRILLIEDSEDDALLIERVMEKGGLSVTIKRVCDGIEMRRALEDDSWDAILCDYMMPEFSVEDAMKELEIKDLDLPFIIVSGTISDEVAVEMMHAGAHDYLTKNNLSRLVPAIRREIGEAEQRRKRRATEQALRESERKHRMLVESLTDTVFVMGKKGEISELYSQTGLIPDASPGKHIAQKLSDLFPEVVVSRFMDTTSEVLESQFALSFEHSLDTRGIQKWFSISVSPHEDGKRVVVVMRDISDLKKAEEEARAAHNIALLYQDITGHDIRNYLQAIIIASDLLCIDESDATRISLLDHIGASVTECSELISSVQSTAALLTTPSEKMSLDSSLKRCLDVFSKDHKDVVIEKRIKKKKAIVNADSFLNHLIMNMLSNAMKYNENTPKRIWVELDEVEGGYAVTIADDGPGISASMKENLLDPERRSGGIGIHQCVQITNKYSGTFDILDRIDGDYTQGAMFRFWLPKTN
ncbi:MAG: response regulator [Candidatus Thorarchaeota archaeon]|nr:response regulator [Candidatus Thorarchaeota archaeon]